MTGNNCKSSVFSLFLFFNLFLTIVVELVSLQG